MDHRPVLLRRGPLRRQRAAALLQGGDVLRRAPVQQLGQGPDRLVRPGQGGAGRVVGPLGPLKGPIERRALPLQRLPPVLGRRRVGVREVRAQGGELVGQLRPAALLPGRLLPRPGEGKGQVRQGLLPLGERPLQRPPAGQPLLRLPEGGGEPIQLRRRVAAGVRAPRGRAVRLLVDRVPELLRALLAPAVQGAAVPLRLGESGAQGLLPVRQGRDPALLGVELRPQGRPGVLPRVQRPQLRPEPVALRRRLAPDGRQTLGGVEGRHVVKNGRELGAELPLALLHRRRRLSGQGAGRVGRLTGGLRRRLGRVERPLRGDLLRPPRRGGVVHRPAHRARLAVHQALGQQPRLPVPERPFETAVALLRVLGPPAGCAIGRLRVRQGAAGRVTARQQLLRRRARPVAVGEPVEPVAQPLPLRRQVLGRRPGVLLAPQEIALPAQVGVDPLPLADQVRAALLCVGEPPSVLGQRPLVPVDLVEDGAAALRAFPVAQQALPLRRGVGQRRQRLAVTLKGLVQSLTVPLLPGLPLPQVLDRPPAGGEVVLPLRQRPIARQGRGQRRQLPRDGLAPGRTRLLLRQGRRGGLRGGGLLRPPDPGRVPLLSGVRELLHPGETGGHVLLGRVQVVARAAKPLLRLRVPVDQLREERRRLRQGQLARAGLVQRGQRLVPLDAAEVLVHAGPGGLALLLQPPGLALEPVLEHHVVPRPEQLAEDLLPRPGVRQQELEEVALGDHGDLGELVAVQPDQRDDGAVHLPALRDHTAVRQVQLRLRPLGGGAAAALGGADVLRAAADGVGLAPVGEDECNVGRRLRPGVLGAEHGRIARRAAGRAVERVGDRVEEGGLPCPGVARDQVQPLPPEPFQLQHGLTGVRPEGGQRQSQRSHGSPSQISSISPRTKARCASPMGRPFCWA